MKVDPQTGKVVKLIKLIIILFDNRREMDICIDNYVYLAFVQVLFFLANNATLLPITLTLY